MKEFVKNWAPVILCSLLLAFANHRCNQERVEEYQRLESKLDAAVEFIGASWGPAEGVAEPETK